jgi:Flp pilus assembly pilin Flp
MSNVITAAQDSSLELVVRSQSAVAELSERMRTRLAEDRGQTAAEYMGILLIVAVIIGALATSGIGDALANAVKKAIGQVETNGNKN